MINKTAQIDAWKPYKTPIEIVQYEGDGRILNFILTSGGSAIDLTASTVVFYAKKPVSGEPIYDSCTITDATAGKVSFTVTTQTCLEAGEMTCFIEITTATPTVIRIQPFIITVVASDDVSGAAESTSEFTALTVALATVTEYDARITQNETDIAANETNISTNTSNIATKVDGAGTVTDEDFVRFDGTNGKTIKGGIALTTSVSDPGSNNNIPTEAAVRTAVNAACGDVTGPGSSTDTSIAIFDGTTGNAIKEATDASSNPILENQLRTAISAVAKFSYQNIGGAL